MCSRTFLLILFVSLIAPFAASADSEFLPAGMLLNCTMDEPNFSSKSAELGDPVLCHIGITTAFGRPVFPRGTYLTGHLQEYKDPGHLYGKGWLSLQFDRLVLPGEAVLPLAAKVVSVPHYKVERDGKIRGPGHAKRDAIEWAVPVLWPIKVLTLPARGPYPALKGEVPLTLRLMEDVAIPAPAIASPEIPMPPWARANDNKGLWHRVDSAVRETLGQEQ
jgi:hypothetical protein